MNEGLSVTISGGKGSDVIVNNCDASLNPYDDEDGSNVLIRYAVGDGKITLAGAASLEYVDIAGVKEFQDSEVKVLDNTSNASVTMGTGVIVADASARTKAIKVVGNSLTNSMVGGTGNDSLWGGDGEDAFIYMSGEGKDVICDFDDDDMLQILGTFSANLETFNPVEILDGIFYR